MYEHHRKNCFGDDIWEYRLPVSLTDEFADHVDDFGQFDAPVPGRTLRRLETCRFVITGNVGDNDLTLRMTGDADPEAVRETIENRIETFIQEQSLEGN